MLSIWKRRAQESADAADPAPLAEVARMLRPAQVQSEEHRAAVRLRLERTLRPVEQREDAGTLDGVDDSPANTHEVRHPDVGGTIVMADIETITPERIAKASAQINDLLNRVGDPEGGQR